MEVHKKHAARKGRDGIGQAVLYVPFACRLVTQPRDGANIALDHMGEERGSPFWFFGGGSRARLSYFDLV